jgi:hypothetical protein
MTISSRLWVLGASDPEMALIERLLVEAGERIAHAVGPDGRRVHPGNAYRAAWFVHPDGRRFGLTEFADLVAPPDGLAASVVLVECGGPGPFPHADGYTVRDRPVAVERVDHHRPGDPGYGRHPEEFLPASSAGQVAALLGGQLPKSWRRQNWHPDAAGRPAGEYALSVGVGGAAWLLSLGRVGPGLSHLDVWVPRDILLAVAADHCLEAAYRGRCPGVDPDALMQWRAESRAAFQGRKWRCCKCGQVRDDSEPGRTWNLSVEDANSPGGQGPCGGTHEWRSPAQQLLADVEIAREALRDAFVGEYADLRGRSIPELPEAAAREGIPFAAAVRDRDGREKVVLQAASPDLVRRFLAGEIVPGLMDTYGDPARGFAGGYTS